jgi:hypothetical protein
MLGAVYARAGFIARQGAMRTSAVAVPKNVSLDLIADTPLRVTTASGAAVPARQKGFTIAIGERPQTVNLRIQ